MNLILTMLLIAFTALAACVSPETTRTRGGDPGADVGNRAKVSENARRLAPLRPDPSDYRRQASTFSRFVKAV
jgi:hypothetical protein